MDDTADTSTMNHFWPLPALLAWALGWGVFRALELLAWPSVSALALGAAAPVAMAWGVRGPWRRLMMAGGFPLSVLASGAGAAAPGWLWLLPLALLLAIYPMQTWRDAPIFPTAPEALAGLDRLIPLPPAARILDAGCGLGHGLQALRSVWPQAAIEGLERSRPLTWAARWRCPWATVRAGDMWQASWAGLDLVYVFQRPDTMARAWDKARAELGPRGWLASLEFEVPGIVPDAVLRQPGQRPVHVYRLGPDDRAVPAQPQRARADKPSRQVADVVAG